MTKYEKVLTALLAVQAILAGLGIGSFLLGPAIWKFSAFIFSLSLIVVQYVILTVAIDERKTQEESWRQSRAWIRALIKTGNKGNL